MSLLWLEIVAFVGGLAALTLGADWVVRGGSRIADRLGLEPLVIGLTIVAFGTSAPELVISGGAAIREEPGLAVGNVMGSTVANVGLIVGFAALVHPMRVHRRLLVRESPLLIFVLAVVMVLSWNHVLGRWDGLALMTGFVIYLFFLFRWAGEGGVQIPAPVEEGSVSGGSSPEVALVPRAVRDWLMTITGLAALLLGAHYVLEGAQALAHAFDVPDAVIGATLVAVGTSLPELASTAAAAFRGMADMAIGNVIGSNVFNLGLVLGSAALLRPLHMAPEQVIRQVVPALLFCLVLIPLAYTGMRVNRWEGLLLLTAYGGFIYWVL